MYFAGRKKEIKRIIAALGQGENAIISGRFGIGRTSLARQIAVQARDRWRFVFVDFSRSPAHACRQMLSAVCPCYFSAHAGGTLPYKTVRHRIVTLPPEDRRQHVLVLDNIERLSRQKNTLLQYLTCEKRFLFIAITETFLPETEYIQLKTALLATCRIRLGRIGMQGVKAYFRHYAARHHFGWTDSRIAHMARNSGGYPLGMHEIVSAERSRAEEDKKRIQKKGTPG